MSCQNPRQRQCLQVSEYTRIYTHIFRERTFKSNAILPLENCSCQQTVAQVCTIEISAELSRCTCVFPAILKAYPEKIHMSPLVSKGSILWLLAFCTVVMIFYMSFGKIIACSPDSASIEFREINFP